MSWLAPLEVVCGCVSPGTDWDHKTALDFFQPTGDGRRDGTGDRVAHRPRNPQIDRPIHRSHGQQIDHVLQMASLLPFWSQTCRG